MTLQNKLLLKAFLLVTIPLVTVVLINRFVVFKHMELQARDEAQTLATELARSTGRFLEGAFSQLEMLARIPPVSNFDEHTPELVEIHLSRTIATSSAFLKFYVATLKGLVTIKVRRDGKPPVKGEMVDHRDYFKKALEGQTVISDVLISNTSGKPIIVAATPIPGPDGPRGVLSGLIDPIRLFAHIYELAGGRDVIPFVIDQNWLVIAHPDQAKIFVENVMDQFTPENWAVMEPLMERDTGQGLMTYQGEKILFAYQWHHPTGWTHIVSRPYKDFTASLVTTRNTALGVWAACFIISVVLALRTVKKITAPVRALVDSTRRVKEGDLEGRVEISTDDEIGELGEAFNVMVMGLREREEMRSAQERMRLELESARVIQQSFLPISLPGAGDIRFSLAAFNHPAASVGGDYYDVIALGHDRLGLVMADVSGKGVPGALYMARLVSDFRFLADPHEDTPADTLNQLNRLLVKRGQQGMFVTLLYMTLDLDRGVVTYANAGHLPMLVHRFGSEVETVDGTGGPPLGIVAEALYKNGQVALEPGDNVVLFTDGVTEAMNLNRELFSHERLVKALQKAPGRPETIVEVVADSVEAFTENAQAHDDITLLVVRWDGGDPHLS